MFSHLVTIAVILSVFVSFTAALTTPAPRPSKRIVNGVNTTIEEVPYQVSVRADRQHYCGGSIMSETIVLSSAHSFFEIDAMWFTVLYGSTEDDRTKPTIPISRIILHPNYNNDTYDYDAALLILEWPISFGSNAQPIALATETPLPQTSAIVTGWGALVENGSYPIVLQKAEVVIIDRSICEDKYKDEEDEITENMLCASSDSGQDHCDGDSGGPLVVDGQQVGIVSWGMNCGNPDYPSVYTNAASVEPWVKEHLQTVKNRAADGVTAEVDSTTQRENF